MERTNQVADDGQKTGALTPGSASHVTLEFIGEKMTNLYEEEANGGLCSMAVHNILTLTKRAEEADQSKGASKDYLTIKEVYNRETHTFSDSALAYRIRKNKTGAVFTDVTKPELVKIGNPLVFNNGLFVRLGFFVDSNIKRFGALTSEGSFVPLVRFHDKRSAADNSCSFAVLEAFGDDDKNIVLSADSEQSVVAMRDERGLVVARQVLDEIIALFENGTYADGQKINDYLDIDTIVNRALDLRDEKLLYDDEQRLRHIVSSSTPLAGHGFRRDDGRYFVFSDDNDLYAHSGVQLTQSTVPGQQGVAGDKVIKTILEPNCNVDEVVAYDSLSPRKRRQADKPTVSNDMIVSQVILYPNANRGEQSRQTIFRLKMGRRIGMLSLLECIATDQERTERDAVRALLAVLQNMNDEPWNELMQQVPEGPVWRSTEVKGKTINYDKTARIRSIIQEARIRQGGSISTNTVRTMIEDVKRGA